MPDADKVYKGLGYKYQSIYKQICEGVFAPSEVAHAALGCIARDLREYGQPPLQLLQSVAKRFGAIPTEPLLKSTVDWAGERNEIDKIGQRISQQTAADKRAMALAVEVCKGVLYEIQHGLIMPENLKVEMYKRYMVCVYEANFEGRMQLTQHDQNVSPEFVRARVQAMRPYIEEGLEHFAKQVARRRGKLTRLRRRPRPAPKPIHLGDDLLAIGGIV